MSNSDAYGDRARLAVILAKQVLRFDLGRAGRFYDEEMARKGKESGWGHGVIIELSCQHQVSYHFHPTEVHLLKNLPYVDFKWDGTYLARDDNFVKNMIWEF